MCNVIIIHLGIHDMLEISIVMNLILPEEEKETGILPNDLLQLNGRKLVALQQRNRRLKSKNSLFEIITETSA
jgi:hypothetical protein